MNEATLKRLMLGRQDRLSSRLKRHVPEWDDPDTGEKCVISCRKYTPRDFIESEMAAQELDGEGKQVYNHQKEKCWRVAQAIDGLEGLKGYEFLSREPYGIVADLDKEITEYSGIGVSIKKVLEEKKTS